MEGQEFEWLGPGEDDVERVPRLNNNDVSVVFRRIPGGFVYEAKIPLARSGRRFYVVGSSPGRTIGVGVETGEFTERRQRQPRNGGGEGMGEEGRRMGGRGGRMPGGRPPGGEASGEPEGSRQPERIKLWTVVTLAAERR